MQWRAPECREGSGVRVAGNQRRDDLGMAHPRGDMQRRVHPGVAGVHDSALGDQLSDPLRIARLGGKVQRAPSQRVHACTVVIATCQILRRVDRRQCADRTSAAERVRPRDQAWPLFIIELAAGVAAAMP